MEWTDDMTVRLARGTSMVMLVDDVTAARAQRVPRSEVLQELTERYALSFDDARLVLDRVVGGVARATSGNPANEPDPVKDPVAWTSYRLALGMPVVQEGLGPSREEESAAVALVDAARRLEPTHGTIDVGVALEATRLAIAATDGGAAKLHIVLEGATCLSVAAEACIGRLGPRPCAAEGSQEWVDGVQLAAAARAIAAEFERGGHPDLEERSYSLAGRIVSRILGQSHALVGRAMLDSARCLQRNGDAEGAADRADAVIADFQALLERFEYEAPFDEHRIGIEYLVAAIELVIEVRGSSPENRALLGRARRTLELSDPAAGAAWG